MSPGHDSLELPITHHRTPRVTLRSKDERFLGYLQVTHTATGQKKPKHSSVEDRITWQESFPPSRNPAQIMLSEIWKGYELKQASSLSRGASKHCSFDGYLAVKTQTSHLQQLWLNPGISWSKQTHSPRHWAEDSPIQISDSWSQCWHTLMGAQQDGCRCSERQVGSVWSAWCRCPSYGGRSQGGECTWQTWCAARCSLVPRCHAPPAELRHPTWTKSKPYLETFDVSLWITGKLECTPLSAIKTHQCQPATSLWALKTNNLSMSCFLLWFAVCSREHPLVRQQGPSAVVVPREERHLIGHRVFWALIPSNYFIIIFQGSCGSKTRHKQVYWPCISESTCHPCGDYLWSYLSLLRSGKERSSCCSCSCQCALTLSFRYLSPLISFNSFYHLKH